MEISHIQNCNEFAENKFCCLFSEFLVTGFVTVRPSERSLAPQQQRLETHWCRRLNTSFGMDPVASLVLERLASLLW